MLIERSIGLLEACLRSNSGRKSCSILAILAYGRDLTGCGEVSEGVRLRRFVPTHPSVTRVRINLRGMSGPVLWTDVDG